MTRQYKWQLQQKAKGNCPIHGAKAKLFNKSGCLDCAIANREYNRRKFKSKQIRDCATRRAENDQSSRRSE